MLKNKRISYSLERCLGLFEFPPLYTRFYAKRKSPKYMKYHPDLAYPLSIHSKKRPKYMIDQRYPLYPLKYHKKIKINKNINIKYKKCSGVGIGGFTGKTVLLNKINHLLKTPSGLNPS